MKLAFSTVVLAALLLSLGCAKPLAVDYDYDTTFDFSKLRTYDWLPSPPGNQIEDMTEKRFRSAVDTQLQARKYSQSAESDR